MLLFLVDYLRVSGIDDTLDKVSCVVHLCKLISIFNGRITLFNLIFGLKLDHLSALANKIKAGRHLLDSLPLVLLEAFEVNEADILDWAFHWHVDRCCHFR